MIDTQFDRACEDHEENANWRGLVRLDPDAFFSALTVGRNALSPTVRRLFLAQDPLPLIETGGRAVSEAMNVPSTLPAPLPLTTTQAETIRGGRQQGMFVRRSPVGSEQ